MTVEQEAKVAAEHEYPRAGVIQVSRVPYAQGYIAGARHPVTDREVEAAARAINPQAWAVYDQSDDDELERKLIVLRSRELARAALEAARAVL